MATSLPSDNSGPDDQPSSDGISASDAPLLPSDRPIDDVRLQREIRVAMLNAQRAGPDLEPLPIVSEAELEAPITMDGGLDLDMPAVELPKIDGYLIMRELRSGGQASVYLAVHEATGRMVAVKLTVGASYSTRMRERVRREAEILAALDHPNIVSIIDRGRAADGSFYIAMPYIEGTDLHEHIATIDRTCIGGVATIVLIFAKLAVAVGEAHARGIVHRDLKPANVRVDRRGEPLVLDFGLARTDEESLQGHGDARSITQTGQLLGSLPWFSPEQAEGHSSVADARSDVYSLGVMIYEALSGLPLYGRKLTVPATLHAIVNVEPQRLRCAGVDERLSAIVHRALAKDPAMRYADAAELAKDLNAFLNGTFIVATLREPIEALPAVAVVPLEQKPRQIGPMLLWVLILGCTSILLLGGWKVARTLWFSPVDYVNRIGMNFVLVKPGEFMMGSPSAEPGRLDDERRHLVRITKPFLISTLEVTQTQYGSVMNSGTASPLPLDPVRAVDEVSWDDAQEFCRRLGKLEGRTYRLPTEAEWEFACRGGHPGPFAGTGRMTDMGWYGGNCTQGPPKVGTKRPNDLGVYDMHGGVAEWCSDFYTAYPAQSVTDPPGQPGMFYRVVRGGNWGDPASTCRAAHRGALTPDIRQSRLGFRVVLVP